MAGTGIAGIAGIAEAGIDLVVPVEAGIDPDVPAEAGIQRFRIRQRLPRGAAWKPWIPAPAPVSAEKEAR